MPLITNDLFSLETVNSLIVQPVFEQSVALASGLKRLSTSSTTVYIPVLNGGSAGWFPELTTISDAGIGADEVPVTPKKVAATQVVSNEAAGDANAAQMVGQALTNALAQSVDQAFFLGIDTDGPAGLLGVTAMSKVTGDADTSLDLYIDAIAKVEEAGGTAGAIYVSPATWALLSKIKTGTGSAQPLLSPQNNLAGATTRSLFGVPVFTSRYVAGNTAWVLDPSRVIVVERTPSTVAVDTSIKFFEDASVLRATMRMEFIAPLPGVVCEIAP